MDAEVLQVEIVTTTPASDAFFMQEGTVYVRIRNRAKKRIRIERVECHFQVDGGFEPYVPYAEPRATLDDGHLSEPINISFVVDLALRSYTNSYKLVIFYDDGILRALEFDPRKHFIFYPVMSDGSSFFISHKDPEDSDWSRVLANFLQKLGFSGYVAEDDSSPGLSLWGEKIPRAIEKSVGMIILWTRNATLKKDSIIRELDISKPMGKKLILAQEPGLRVPRNFPKDIEYFQFKGAISSAELKRLACSMEKTYRQGGYLGK